MQIGTNITETETKTENKIKNLEITLICWVEVDKTETIMQIAKEMRNCLEEQQKEKQQKEKNNRKKKTIERYRDRRAEMLD